MCPGVVMQGMLDIHEIYPSIEGETTAAGWPFVFIRLAGCNLSCIWCDTRYAWKEGRKRDVGGIVNDVRGYGLRRVVVTGGEPLIQAESLELIKSLADEGFDVYLETNGAVDIGLVDKRARVRMDLKPPSSGMTEHILWDNIGKLKPVRDGVVTDEVKIVIAGPEDYAWACNVIEEKSILKICPVNLTPELDTMLPHLLARWIIDDKLDVRLNLQMHKIIWGEGARGV